MAHFGAVAPKTNKIIFVPFGMEGGWGQMRPQPPVKCFFYLRIIFGYRVEEEKMISTLLSGGVQTKRK
jgi:hypothetical protein